MSRGVSTTHVILVLSFGLLAISTASILIKLCPAPALTITFYRVGIASLLYGLFSGSRRGSHEKITPRQWMLALASGGALALHFITWISSLQYTSVASSVVLVVTSPIWVALASYLFLKEKCTWGMVAGIVVTLTGSLIVGGFDFLFSKQSLLGNSLAIAGAVFVAIYLVIGRTLRSTMGTFFYVTIVYGMAALITLIFIAFSRAPLWGFDVRTVIFLILIALLPQMIGHTSFNWALRYFSATVVAIVSLGEPIGASILAWIVLGEHLTLTQLVGGAFILLGLAITLIFETRKRADSKHL